MDDLVKRIKNYYQENPHYLYEVIEGHNRVVDNQFIQRNTRSRLREGIDITHRIKPVPGPVSKEEIFRLSKSWVSGYPHF